ncbi:MAG TPA: amino acid permease [Yinghuangia sp.]|uniref:amino acid permease n=1 Tax=Yinghuangia sp. YIM S10712 TaxID=3436930 RepID=UPI002CDFCF24|nr:amino acid permease [Yinghuangia sp.]
MSTISTGSPPAPPASAAQTADAADAGDLASFGYPQQLRRNLGSFASFAAGFSFVSILTTVFQLFAFGFSFGGPAFFWTWPVVFAGQLLVALCFAELAARYPIAGCVYQWSRRLSTGVVGWFAGWLMLIGQIVSVAAAAIALQVVLPRIWSGFQIVGTDTSLASTDGATNAVLLGSLLIVVTTVITAVGVKVMSLVNSVGVACELVGIVLLIILLFGHAERGPSVVAETGGAGGSGGYFTAFLASALMAAYVMYGFDSAGELAEETKNPRKTAPKAIVRALVASGVMGLLLLLGALMAAPSVTDGELAAGGLPYVITSQLGTGLGKALLVDVAIAMFVCTLAIQTAATRLVFSMSRDGVLPASGRLARVSPRTGTPVLPALVVGVLAAALLVVNMGRAELFTALTSVAIVLVYVAYLLVTLPMLIARRRGRLSPHEGFSLGRFGLVVNVGAVAYGLLMTVNIAWPRAEVYDPAGGHWYLRWFAPLFVAVAVAAGAAAYARLRRERTRAAASGTAAAGVAS